MEKSAIGQYLAKRRRALHLTQSELANLLKQHGVDREESTIAGWERGHAQIPIELIPKIAEALGEPANRLYELAGVLDNIKGGDIAALLADQSDDTIETATNLVKTILKKKP